MTRPFVVESPCVAAAIASAAEIAFAARTAEAGGIGEEVNMVAKAAAAAEMDKIAAPRTGVVHMDMEDSDEEAWDSEESVKQRTPARRQDRAKSIRIAIRTGVGMQSRLEDTPSC